MQFTIQTFLFIDVKTSSVTLSLFPPPLPGGRSWRRVVGQRWGARGDVTQADPQSVDLGTDKGQGRRRWRERGNVASAVVRELLLSNRILTGSYSTHEISWHCRVLSKITTLSGVYLTFWRCVWEPFWAGYVSKDRRNISKPGSDKSLRFEKCSSLSLGKSWNFSSGLFSYLRAHVKLKAFTGE